MKRWLYTSVVLVIVLVAAACTGNVGAVESSTTEAPGTSAPTETVDASPNPGADGLARNQAGYVFPDAPEVLVDGDLEPETQAALDALWDSLGPDIDDQAIVDLGRSDDVRVAWLLLDVLRFVQGGPTAEAIATAVTMLTDLDLDADPVANRSPWQSLTDHLIAWDLPAPPEYQMYKGRLFTIIEPAWQPFFDDANAAIDWRFTSWGGVRIDSRPLGDRATCARGCIPALDDPATTDAAGGSWYPDDRVVFGVVVNGEARAYPKHQMEVHEMINDTLGGRRLGIPYCTLCGSAQAYFTDSVPPGVEVPVLRTSGLLTRSNKVMYDLITFSIFDTFTGEAITGPLHDKGVSLEQTTVVTSTWGEWKVAHPDTTILAFDGGVGRGYPLDPLRGRDDSGPIFPIGDVDPRLPTQSQVVGVVLADGTAVAFAVDDLATALASTDSVQFTGIIIMKDGGGFRATLRDGTQIASHQAFWFAWSQFHPETLVYRTD
jgi:hypothetical protein